MTWVLTIWLVLSTNSLEPMFQQEYKSETECIQGMLSIELPSTKNWIAACWQKRQA
jgi:hypothetical protein